MTDKCHSFLAKFTCIWTTNFSAPVSVMPFNIRTLSRYILQHHNLALAGAWRPAWILADTPKGWAQSRGDRELPPEPFFLIYPVKRFFPAFLNIGHPQRPACSWPHIYCSWPLYSSNPYYRHIHHFKRKSLDSKKTAHKSVAVLEWDRAYQGLKRQPFLFPFESELLASLEKGAPSFCFQMCKIVNDVLRI